MEKEAGKFLAVQETATKLVSTLTELYNEANSYKAAKEELGSVRNKLVDLIDSTKDVVENSSHIIETLKEIGALGILERLTKLRLLIYITLGSSIITLIISIIALIK